MSQERMHNYFHMITTLRLACAQPKSSNKYVSKVAIRLATKSEFTDLKMICVGVSKNKQPKEMVQTLYRNMVEAYESKFIDWRNL